MLFRFWFQLFHTFQINKHADVWKDVWIPFGFVVSGSVFVYALVSMFLTLTSDFFIVFAFFFTLHILWLKTWCIRNPLKWIRAILYLWLGVMPA